MSPLHDYECGSCGYLLLDQYRSVTEGASGSPPTCPSCGQTTTWIPKIGAMDVLSDGSSSAKFQMYDGQNKLVTIGSYAQMRQLERDSEQQYRNGEGQPLRFRALHRNRSNMQDNTFGEQPNQKPTEEGKRKFGLRGATKQVSAESAAERTYGPGVNDSNTSALKD